MQEAKATPTGCYKCGRPGHWSRDCPDSNANPTSGSVGKFDSSRSFPSKSSTSNGKPVVEKPVKVPRSRPKITPDLLVKDDNGLGYILRHFPRNFKYRGRGHEVKDLENLIGLYSEWHSRLLPYYTFPQFILRLEQVTASKRVKMCIRDLRERVANGGDPTKLHESGGVHADPVVDQGASLNSFTIHEDENPSPKIDDATDVTQEQMLHEVYATQGSSLSPHNDSCLPIQNNPITSSVKVAITEEQRARMESNRIKALEKVAARALH